MKLGKILTLVLCAVLLAALCLPSAAYVTWTNKTCTAYVGTITVDGTIDDLWNDVEWIPVTNLKTGSYLDDASKTPADYASLNCKVMWNGTDTLYYLYDVKDKVICTDQATNDWENDSIEFYIDENDSRDGTFDEDAHQIRILAQEGENSGDGWVSACKFTSDGYVVEVAYTFSSATIKDGAKAGIDFQVNDDADGDGTRDACLGWGDVDDEASSNSAVWGEVQFSSATAESQVPVVETTAAPAAADTAAAAADTAAPAAAATTAAQTSDYTAAIAVAAIVCAGFAFALSRRHE